MALATSTSSSTGMTSIMVMTGLDESAQVQTESYDYYGGINTGGTSTSEGDAVTMTIGGDATATAENTLAVGDVFVALDGGGGTGTASFTAIATGDDTAFADASAFAVVDGTADIILMFSESSSDTLLSPEGAISVATASVSITVIDLPLADTSWADGDTSLDGLVMEAAGTDGTGIAIDGNLAMLTVDAAVYDDSSFLLVDAFTFTLEDMMATVSAVVVAEAG